MASAGTPPEDLLASGASMTQVTGLSQLLSAEGAAPEFDPNKHFYTPRLDQPIGLALDKPVVSMPFKMLSPAGVKAARQEVFRYRCEAKASNHTSSTFPYLYHNSPQFFGRIMQNTDLRLRMSELAGTELVPYAVRSHCVQANINDPTGLAPAASWHVDTPEYVIVLLLTDMTHPSVRGGDLRIIADKGVEEGWKEIDADPVNAGKLVSNKTPGQGVFMNGRAVLHTATKYWQGVDTRITVVFSYMRANDTSLGALRLHLHETCDIMAMKEYLEWHMQKAEEEVASGDRAAADKRMQHALATVNGRYDRGNFSILERKKRATAKLQSRL